MARDDYSRGMDELRAKETSLEAYKGTLDGWYKEKLPLLEQGKTASEELARLKAAGGISTDASATMKALEGFVKKEDVDKYVSEQLRRSEEVGIHVMTQMSGLVAQHQHQYNKPLDTAALLVHARSKNLSLVDAYRELTADDAKALQDKRAKEERSKLEQEIRSQLQKEMGHGVYPVASEESTSPTLAGLSGQKKSADGAENFGVKAALDEYYRMNKT
jgi:hypothetical protein